MHLSYMHCIVPIIGYVYAVIVCAGTEFGNHYPESTIFTVIMLSSLPLIIVSFFTFKGNKANHFILLATLPSAGYFFLTGGMAITHDWL